MFLVRKGLTNKAKKTMKWLYGPECKVEEEIEIIGADLKDLESRKSGYKGVTEIYCFRYVILTNYFSLAWYQKFHNHPEIYKPFWILLFLTVIQQATGMSILRGYVIKIFDDVFNHNVTQSNGGNQTHSQGTSIFTLQQTKFYYIESYLFQNIVKRQLATWLTSQQL